MSRQRNYFQMSRRYFAHDAQNRQDPSLRSRRKDRRDRAGTTVVEFAIIAPLFLLLLFGILEFGRVVMVQQLITNASREGARMAVVTSPDDPAALSVVQSEIASRLADVAGVQPGDLQVNITRHAPVNTTVGGRVEVDVSVPFDKVSWLNVPMFPMTPQTLTAKSVMRQEGFQ